MAGRLTALGGVLLLSPAQPEDPRGRPLPQGAALPFQAARTPGALCLRLDCGPRPGPHSGSAPDAPHPG